MTENKTEIERKFLLKRFPEVKTKAHIFYKNKVIYQDITQYYLKDGSKIRRNVIKDPDKGVYKNQYVRFTHVLKSGGGLIRNDTVHHIDLEQYEELKKNAVSMIKKNREEVKFDDHNFLIDTFRNIDLVMAEIEVIPEEHGREDIYSISLPSEIQEDVIMEVTPFEQFKNKQLAIKL